MSKFIDQLKAYKIDPKETAAFMVGKVMSCKEWGANNPKSNFKLIKPDCIVIHHMANANRAPADTGNISKTGIRLAQQCQGFHMNENGWADTGQHFTNSIDGMVLEGRWGSKSGLMSTGGMYPMGAHCEGENGHTIGIENEGLYTSFIPSRVQMVALIGLLALICQKGRIDSQNIIGHRSKCATACPGDALFELLPEIRRMVHDAVVLKNMAK